MAKPRKHPAKAAPVTAITDSEREMLNSLFDDPQGYKFSARLQLKVVLERIAELERELEYAKQQAQAWENDYIRVMDVYDIRPDC